MNLEDYIFFNTGYDLKELDTSYKIYKVRTNNKYRQIEEPNSELKLVQRALIPLFESFELSMHCIGGRKHLSILDNANIHISARHLLKIDIKNCYQSITSNLLPNLEPLEEHREQLISLCMIQNKENNYILPTGAPTSPILCNISLTQLDSLASTIAKEYNYQYTRYIDDLIFSTDQEVRTWDLKKKIEDLILDIGLTPNYRKNRWYTRGKNDKLIVTGVSLEGSKVPREFSRKIRSKLQNLAKAGQQIDQETHGCLAYIKSIDPEKYSYFINYFKQRQLYGKV